MSVEDALKDARDAVIVRPACTEEDLLDLYLNGPRTLSNDLLSALIIAGPPAETPIPETSSVPESSDFNIMLCATHFIGDGHALHSTATELFTLLGSRHDPKNPGALFLDLLAILETEWAAAYGLTIIRSPLWLPESTEARLPAATCKFQDAATKVEFQCNESRLTVRTRFSLTSCSTRTNTPCRFRAAICFQNSLAQHAEP